MYIELVEFNQFGATYIHRQISLIFYEWGWNIFPLETRRATLLSLFRLPQWLQRRHSTTWEFIVLLIIQWRETITELKRLLCFLLFQTADC